jgi:glycosyltransferase involved in cell wall biosynthesis
MDLERFKGKYEVKQVKENLNNVNQNPLVSVCVQTYNHVDYIKQCLDGILFQKTTFEFEILLGEDDSIDGTRELCVDYAKRYPDKIRLFLHHRENNIKIGGQPTGRFNFLYNLHSSKGEYIALCEGDDYWTDPLKLQKQVDFLEGNPEYVVCCHNAKIINEKGNLIQDKKLPKLIQDRDYSSLELQKGAFLLTLTMVFRNVLEEYPKNFSKVLNGDTFLISLLGGYGKGRYVEDIELAAYRVHSGGIWSELDNSKRLKARRVFNQVLMSHYKSKAHLYFLFYDKQVNVSRTLLRNLRSADTFKDYLDYNFFYIRYNNILKSKYRLKELLKFNWFYWRDLINNSFS